MKKTLLALATGAALALAAPLHADESEGCLDAACDLRALYADDSGAGSGAATATAIEAKRLGRWGIDTDGMDTRVKPGTDFFGYVNGT
ncbi:hypothetical protein [Lysobacter sp. N42]|uniref:hypothetical protein n=1 Tax=Lysobacter sp. N42 TaxID=2545719 RepID=UPI001FB81DD4|nr:hypothetical protein [Lysobacter sp. N42]